MNALSIEDDNLSHFSLFLPKAIGRPSSYSSPCGSIPKKEKVYLYTTLLLSLAPKRGRKKSFVLQFLHVLLEIE